MAGPLSHVKVLDLSRILAAPWAGQILADLGAEVIKVERPGAGDDTRAWGPPFLKGPEPARTPREAGYYLAVNRGKRSITVNLDNPEGQRIVRALARRPTSCWRTTRSARWSTTGSTSDLAQGQSGAHLLLDHRLRPDWAASGPGRPTTS